MPKQAEPTALAQIRADLAAVDAMLTCTRDHIASAIDASHPSGATRVRLLELKTHIDRAVSTVAWLGIDLDDPVRRATLANPSQN